MVKAPHDRVKAHRVFTDRKDPLQLFETALTKPQSTRLDSLDSYRVLVWYGDGGQGKTELRKECYRRILARKEHGEQIATGMLDFELARHRNPVDAMLKLRLDLGCNGVITFPTFDLAFAHLFSLEHPGDDIRAAHPGLYCKWESEIIENLLGWSGEVAKDALAVGSIFLPAAGLLYKYGHHLAGRLWEWWESREAKLHVAEIDSLLVSELREKLPVYLGFDLWRVMHDEDSLRVVLMFDTYEALGRETAGQGTIQTQRIDNWVRLLIESVPGALIAIFGRDKLRWAEIDSDWGRILDSHLLGGLSDEDAERFLKKAGVTSRSVRARIIEGAQGLPFYLDLALDQYDDCKADGHEPNANDFGTTPVLVLHRFLDHLTDNELDVLKLASYPENIDNELLEDLVSEFLGGPARANWTRLTRHSFMAIDENERASMHAMMRTGLQSLEHTERADLFHDIHLWLFNRYDTQAGSAETIRQIGEKHDHALVAAARHLAITDSSRLSEWILQPRWKIFYNATRWQALSDTFDVVSNAIENSASIDLKQTVWVYHHHAHVYQNMGLYDEAMNLFGRALATYKDAGLSKSDPEHATILHALGDVARKKGNTAKAETLFSKALEIYQAAPGSYDLRYADVLFSLALIRESNGDEAEAMSHYRKAQDVYLATLGEQDPDYANFLLTLGRSHRSHGRTDEAEILFRKVLDIYKKTRGERHPGYATILLDLSDCLAASGKQREAEASYEQSVATYTDVLGPEHPHLGQALHHQAMFWSEDDNKRESAADQLERAIAILVAARGDEHAWTMEARKDLHRLQRTTG